jgi:hypothetical protein
MQSSMQSSYIEDTLKYLSLKSSSILKSTKIDYLSTVQNSSISPSERQSLINHLGVVSHLLSLDTKVFELSVLYIDRFLSSIKLKDKRTFQLLGFVCLNIAAEYSGSKVFRFDEIVSMTQNCFSSDLIKTMKLYVMNALDWRLDMVTCSELIFYMALDGLDPCWTLEILEKSRKFIEKALGFYELRVFGLFSLSISVIFTVLLEKKLDYHEEWLGEAWRSL